MRDELARAEGRVLKLAEEVSRIARRLKEDAVQMSIRQAETDARHRSERASHERLRMIVSVLAMLVGGFLAGQVVNWRFGAKEAVRPAAIEPGTSASKAAPAAPRRSAGQGTRPSVKPAR